MALGPLRCLGGASRSRVLNVSHAAGLVDPPHNKISLRPHAVETRGLEETLEVTKMMRRSFLQGVAAAASALPLMESTARTQPNPPGRKLLLKGGYVVSCDKSIGEFKSGDVLIDGAKIENVGVDLPSGDADVIDARNKLVLPGLIDTHRHTWETQLRSMIPEGDFFVYLKVILQTVAPRYRPDDAYIGNL